MKTTDNPLTVYDSRNTKTLNRSSSSPIALLIQKSSEKKTSSHKKRNMRARSSMDDELCN